jgi:hypothetical protein
MLYKLAAYVHAFFFRRAQGIRAALEGERGQGTGRIRRSDPAGLAADGRHGGCDEGLQ